MLKVGRLILGAVLVASMLLPIKPASAATNLRAELSGQEEVPPGSGDPNGDGVAEIEIRLKKRKLCWNVVFFDINNATALHIHEGDPGVDGPIFLPLEEFAEPHVSPLEGCRKFAKRDLREIRDEFTHFYVNVHTQDFPNGAIRGQLEEPAPA